MRYIIVGAGAIGATIGGRLADSGSDVVLVARGEHGRALRSVGLHLTLPDREIQLRLPTVTLDELELGLDDVLVVAVKSQHSADVVAQLAELSIGQRSAGELLPILCAQNGISNEDLALRFFVRVHGVCVNLPATHLEPGRVVAEGAPRTGVLHVGRYPHGVDATDTDVVANLVASGFAASACDDVMAWKRAKLLRNVANALEVLCGNVPPLGKTAKDHDHALHLVRRRAAEEAQACFAAGHLSVVGDDDYRAATAGQASPVPIEGRERQGGSTWQSVQRRQGSVETDFLNGEIVRLGRLHRVATPVNETIQASMRVATRNGEAPQPIDPASLLS